MQTTIPEPMAKKAARPARRFRWRTTGYLILKYLLLLLFSLFFIFPYFYMLTRSLMSLSEINSGSLVLFPSELHFENYSIVVDYLPYLKNTLIVVVINGLFIPLTGSFIAFPFARYDFKGKKIMFALLMCTVMLPGSVTTIPLYVLYSKLSLLDTLASQWVGAFFGGSAMQMFLIMQFMRGVPKELDNAAYLDGANRFVVYFRIMLPMCMNVLLYIGIGVILAKWNDFTGPLVYLRSQSNYTMAVAFYYEFSSSGISNLFDNIKMAMVAFMTVVPMLLFLIFQKQMIGGIKVGGLKG